MVTIWSRLGIQKKILASLAVIVLLMLAAVVVDAFARITDRRLSDDLILRLLPARTDLRSAKRLILAADDDGAWYLLSGESTAGRGYLRGYRSDLTQISAWLGSAQRTLRSSSDEALLAAFKARFDAYQQGNEKAFALARAGKAEQARRAYVNVGYVPMMHALNQYEAVAVQAQIRGVEEQRFRVRRFADAFAAAIGIGSVALAVTVGVRTGGMLRRRLGKVSNALADVVGSDLVQLDESFRNIAEGNLSAPRYVCVRPSIDDRGGDELALLAASYNRLIEGLRDLSQRIDESVLDARRRLEVEQRLQYLQEYDDVTGMPNRHLLQAELDRAIHAHTLLTGPIAIAYFGVIGLDKIQDSFGRPFAERALKLTAERLKDALRPTDIPARGGGDGEFIAALDPVDGRDDAMTRTRELITRLSGPFNLDGRELVVSVSAGLSMYPRDGRDADELLRNATTAMSYAKTSGSGEVALYRPSLRSQSLERVTLESDLKRAIAAKEFEVHYQPIVNVATRHIDAFEALLRWRHPRFGLLEPASFIDVAEDTGAIEALGTWVLQTACAQGRSWHQSGHDVGISVNVSMRQFRGDVLGVVEGALASTDFPARQLELELTESLLLTDRPRAQNALGELKRLGVRVAIDDFGTGYSSLAYLRTFPLDALKIDRSFVSDITSKSYDEAIARTIILLGRTLGVRVIAEGVEDVQQAAILHKLGCDAMQGYFFGKPSPANEWMQLLESMA